MALEEATIQFYKVDRCGWYKYKEQVPVFGNLGDVFSQLAAWSDGVGLASTRLTPIDEDDNEYPTYLFGLYHRRSDWVFATWNQVPYSESGVASVQENSIVGAPQVVMNEIAQDSIPGYATYFWIIPEHNVIASVRFNRAQTGQFPMSKYVSQFMATASAYAVVAEDDEEEHVIGFRNDPDSAPQRLRALFKTSVFAKAGPRDFLLANHHRIKKIIRRGHVSATEPSELRWWQSSLRTIFRSGAAAQGRAVINKRVYVELDYCPSLAELNEIIAGQDEDIDAAGFDDVGFELAGEGSTKYWLSRERARGTFDLDIVRHDEETIDLPSLLTALQNQRQRILALLE